MTDPSVPPQDRRFVVWLRGGPDRSVDHDESVLRARAVKLGWEPILVVAEPWPDPIQKLKSVPTAIKQGLAAGIMLPSPEAAESFDLLARILRTALLNGTRVVIGDRIDTSTPLGAEHGRDLVRWATVARAARATAIEAGRARSRAGGTRQGRSPTPIAPEVREGVLADLRNQMRPLEVSVRRGISPYIVSRVARDSGVRK